MKRSVMRAFRIIAILFIVSLSIGGCNYVKNVQLLRGGSVNRTAFVDSLSFGWTKDLIVVPVTLQDEEDQRQMIFDTAAFDGKVEYGLATGIGLDVVSSKTSGTAQGVSREIETIRIDSLALGTTRFLDIGAGKLRYGSDSASQCIASHGIIGGNLIRLANWRIDYPRKMMYFSDEPFPQEPGLESISFKTPALSGVPSVSISVGGRVVSGVLFDTGYNGGLVLPLELASAFDAPLEAVILDHASSGIHGSNADSVMVKELEVQLGGAIATIPVTFSALGKALLGNDFLEHFVVTLDYESRQIQLSQREPIAVDRPRTFLPGVLDPSTWIVRQATPDLGVAVGDTLRTVNGKTPSELYTSFCDWVLNLDRLYEGSHVDVQTIDNRLLRIPVGK